MKRTTLQLLLSILILAGCVMPAKAHLGLGPKKEAVDITSYPVELHSSYKIFKVRCSACHSLSESMGTPRSEQGWAQEVKRMQAMASSHISDREADEIAKFLVYHEGHRTPAESPETAGKALFEKYGCSGCHSVGGQGNTSFPLDGIGSRRTGRELQHALTSPPAGSPMPATQAPEEDMQGLVAYLRMLKNHGWGW